MKNIVYVALCLVLLTACTSPVVIEVSVNPTATPAAATAAPATLAPATLAAATPAAPSAPSSTAAQSPSATALPATTATTGGVTGNPSAGKIPAFDHIVLILLENHGVSDVIGNSQMPNFNAWAKQYVQLTQYYAIRHPSLPNYISLVSGNTFGITKDCSDCFLNQPNLADRIEASGRTWKDYQEGMPSPCYVGNDGLYMQKHNPFIYFDSIRLNPARCEKSVVPLSQLDADLSAKQLPNFAFIMPNMCNSSHDCGLDVADQWLGTMVSKLQNSQALGQNSLIIIVFDEADGHNDTCCGLSKSAGGQVAALLISPMAKPGFQDSTPYSHYSLLKTILTPWGMPDLANTGSISTLPITEPWK